MSRDNYRTPNNSDYFDTSWLERIPAGLSEFEEKEYRRISTELAFATVANLLLVDTHDSHLQMEEHISRLWKKLCSLV